MSNENGGGLSVKAIVLGVAFCAYNDAMQSAKLQLIQSLGLEAFFEGKEYNTHLYDDQLQS